MNTRANGTPTSPSEPAVIDLTQETEDTRRKLYDAAVATHFTTTPEEQEKAAADPDNHWQPPAYTPDQARLTVHQLFGRWFVTWRLLEEKEGEVPPHRLWNVLRVTQDSETGALEYHEV
jgi:hypothetical protein